MTPRSTCAASANVLVMLSPLCSTLSGRLVEFATNSGCDLRTRARCRERTARIAVQRAASLMQLPGPAGRVRRRAWMRCSQGTGVTPDQLRPDAFIPYAAFLAILDNACRATGRDDIGMLLGKRQTLAALGPLGGACATPPRWARRSATSPPSRAAIRRGVRSILCGRTGTSFSAMASMTSRSRSRRRSMTLCLPWAAT